MTTNGYKGSTFSIDEPLRHVDLSDFNVAALVSLGGGEGGKVCLLKALQAGMRTGALSHLDKYFDASVPLMYIGGEGDEEGEKTGEGQYSSYPRFLLEAWKASGKCWGKLKGGGRWDLHLDIEEWESEYVGDGDGKLDGDKAR